MKNKYYIFIFLFTYIFSSCNNAIKEEEKQIEPKSPVQITSMRIGAIDNQLTFSATTVYLKRNVITAEIPAFIIKVNIHLGDKVLKGQVLYELQTKESKALGSKFNNSDTILNRFGVIKIYAPASGIISTFDKQQTGDYVLEGTQLCTIAEGSDLAFQINVPFEYIQYTKVGSKCKITLPDNSVQTAIIKTPLTTMNVLSQTQTILAKSSSLLLLPENLIVKVQVIKNEIGNKQIIEKSCVLSDEMMQSFWIMKLINDSTAVKVPIILGNQNETEMEVLSPKLELKDRIIFSGNYGLLDTARVKILN